MSEDKYQQIARLMESESGSVSGQMFGKPCLKVPEKKAYAAFFRGEMCFKLPLEEVHSYKQKYSGSQNWDPSGKGRAMKEWLQVPAAYETDWADLARQAFNYVNNA